MKRIYLLSYILSLLIPSIVLAETVVVEQVIDSWTIELTNGEKVRLIGINDLSGKIYTERIKKEINSVEALREKSKEFTKTWLEKKTIKLKYDLNNKHINHRDKDGKLLAYVYCKVPKGYVSLKTAFDDEWVMFNEVILNAGYACVLKEYPFQYMAKFEQYEVDARIHHLGLWKSGEIREDKDK